MAWSRRNDSYFHVRSATGEDEGKVAFSYYERHRSIFSVLMPGHDARLIGELLIQSADEARDALAADLAKGLPPR